jgi:hypothetical protein
MNQSLIVLTDLESQLRTADTPGEELAAQLVHAARWALEQNGSLSAVKDVTDHLRAAQVYFKQRHATMIATNLLSSELIRCQWRLGNELLRIPRDAGGRGNVSQDGNSFAAHLEQANIKSSSAYRWQMLAQVDAQDLEQYLSEMLERDEITTAATLNYFTAHVTVDPRADGEPTPEPPSEYEADTNEPPQPHVVTIVCRHCGTKDAYEVAA